MFAPRERYGFRGSAAWPPPADDDGADCRPQADPSAGPPPHLGNGNEPGCPPSTEAAAAEAAAEASCSSSSSSSSSSPLYSLLAVVCHKGDIAGGHYISYVKVSMPRDVRRVWGEEGHKRDLIGGED